MGWSLKIYRLIFTATENHVSRIEYCLPVSLLPATGGIPLRSGQSASGGPVPPYWRGSCDGSASCVRRSLACSGLPADTKSILARVRSSNHARMTRLVRLRVRVVRLRVRRVRVRVRVRLGVRRVRVRVRVRVS